MLWHPYLSLFHFGSLKELRRQEKTCILAYLSACMESKGWQLGANTAVESSCKVFSENIRSCMEVVTGNGSARKWCNSTLTEGFDTDKCEYLLQAGHIASISLRVVCRLTFYQGLKRCKFPEDWNISINISHKGKTYVISVITHKLSIKIELDILYQYQKTSWKRESKIVNKKVSK